MKTNPKLQYEVDVNENDENDENKSETEENKAGANENDDTETERDANQTEADEIRIDGENENGGRNEINKDISDNQVEVEIEFTDENLCDSDCGPYFFREVLIIVVLIIFTSHV